MDQAIVVYGVSVDDQWIARRLSMDCARVFNGLSMDWYWIECLWIVQGLSTGCVRVVIGLSLDPLRVWYTEQLLVFCGST
jgi:hypothetical protein